jgi:lambda repressor-like predicted transcriptional regulator
MGISDRRARLAAEIRAELGRQNKSAAELSAGTGIRPDTLRRRLNGRYPLMAEELLVICTFLGVSIGDLTARTEDAA